MCFTNENIVAVRHCLIAKAISEKAKQNNHRGQKKCENDTNALNYMGWLCLLKKNNNHKTQNNVGECSGHRTPPLC